MGIFSTIKDAIFGKPAMAAEPQASDVMAGVVATAAAAAAAANINQMVAENIDISARLEEMSAGKNLNWRSSIVDLMKLVGMESSLAERKELATELGYSGALDGSAEMNIWLHKAVMRELAANGGIVPAELLD